MADISTITASNGTTYNIKDSTARGLLPSSPIRIYTSLTGTAAKTSSPYYCARYDVTDSSVTEYTDGMMVSIRVPVAGNGNYGTALQINSLGYKPIVSNVNTMISTRYSVGAQIIAVYNSTQTGSLYINSASASTVTGCWQVCDYNTADGGAAASAYRLRDNYALPKINSSAFAKLYRYMIVLPMMDGTYVPVNGDSNKATTYTKVLNTTNAFNPFEAIRYYSSTTTVEKGGAIGAGTLYIDFGALDMRYSFNLNSSGTAGTTALTENLPVYLKAKYNYTTHTAVLVPNSSSSNYLERSSLVQALPSSNPDTGLNSNETYIYIFLGYAYNKYQIHLTVQKTVYHWDSANGCICVFDGNRPEVWGKSSNGGVYFPSDMISAKDCANGSLVVVGGTDDRKTISSIISTNSKAGFIFSNLSTWTMVSSAAAGATSYTFIASSNVTLGDGSYDYLKNFYFSAALVDNAVAQKPTSVTVSGSNIVLTFASSLNPNEAITKLYAGIDNAKQGAFLVGNGIYANAQDSFTIGSFVSNSGNRSIVAGQAVSNTGTLAIMNGTNNKNTGTRSVVVGSKINNIQGYSLVIGEGHDTIGGTTHMGVIGKYSTITPDVAFAVGNGTAANARSNAFVVHTDGRATVNAAPTADLDVATKKYVDDSVSGGGGHTTTYYAQNKSVSSGSNVAVTAPTYYEYGQYFVDITGYIYSTSRTTRVYLKPTSSAMDCFYGEILDVDSGNFKNMAVTLIKVSSTSYTYRMAEQSGSSIQAARNASWSAGSHVLVNFGRIG